MGRHTRVELSGRSEKDMLGEVFLLAAKTLLP